MQLFKKYFLTGAIVSVLLAALFLFMLFVGPIIPVFTSSVFSNSEFEEGVGVVVLAPDGPDAWAGVVNTAVRDIEERFPTEIAFGETDIVALHAAVEKLKIQGVDKIIMIPLLMSSYDMGLRGMSHLHSVLIDVPFVVGEALDRSPLIVSIVADSVRESSSSPYNDTLIIVTNGHVSRSDRPLWKRETAKFGASIRSQSGFRRVVFAGIEGEDDLLSVAVREGRNGRLVVMPLAVNADDVRKQIRRLPQGIDYNFIDKPILTHPKMREWLDDNIERQLVRLNWEILAEDEVVVSI